MAGGCVKASYGRKKNLRAIWLCQEDDNQKRPATARGKARHVPVLVWSPSSPRGVQTPEKPPRGVHRRPNPRALSLLFLVEVSVSD